MNYIAQFCEFLKFTIAGENMEIERKGTWQIWIGESNKNKLKDFRDSEFRGKFKKSEGFLKLDENSYSIIAILKSFQHILSLKNVPTNNTTIIFHSDY